MICSLRTWTYIREITGYRKTYSFQEKKQQKKNVWETCLKTVKICSVWTGIKMENDKKKEGTIERERYVLAPMHLQLSDEDRWGHYNGATAHLCMDLMIHKHTHTHQDRVNRG